MTKLNVSSPTKISTLEWAGEPTNSDSEPLELRFFGLDRLPKIADPVDRRALELFKEKLG